MAYYGDGAFRLNQGFDNISEGTNLQRDVWSTNQYLDDLAAQARIREDLRQGGDADWGYDEGENVIYDSQNPIAGYSERNPDNKNGIIQKLFNLWGYTPTGYLAHRGFDLLRGVNNSPYYNSNVSPNTLQWTTNDYWNDNSGSDQLQVQTDRTNQDAYEDYNLGSTNDSFPFNPVGDPTPPPSTAPDQDNGPTQADTGGGNTNFDIDWNEVYDFFNPQVDGNAADVVQPDQFQLNAGLSPMDGNMFEPFANSGGQNFSGGNMTGLF